MLLLILFIIPALVLAMKFFAPKLSFSLTVTKVFFWIFIMTFLFFISTQVLSKYNLFWRGYRSSSFIYLSWCLSSIFLYWVYSARNYHGIFNMLFGTLVFVLSFSGTFITFEIIDDYNKKLFYKDNKYRLEEDPGTLMYIPKLPKLFVKKGFFESRYLIDTIYDNPDFTYPTEYYVPKNKIKKIILREISSNMILITIYHSEDTNSRRTNPLLFTAIID